MNTNAPRTNEEQIALWNGSAGRAWVETQESLDRLFEPFEAVLGDIAAARRAQHVLDVGCGTGATTLAMARRHASCAPTRKRTRSRPRASISSSRGSA